MAASGEVLQEANTARRITPADFTALALLAFMAIGAAAIGFVPVNIYSHDLFIPLDGAWRVLNGQRPHADFVTPLGPVFYLIQAGGMLLAGGTAKGLAYASTITSTVLAAWAYLISRRRLAPAGSIAFLIFIFVLSFAPVALGDPEPSWHTYAMIYTRWGVSLMSILVVEFFTWESGSQAGGSSTGMIWALLLFLKINLFIVTTGLVGISLFLFWDSRRLRDIAIGFFLVAALVAGYLRFDLFAMWRDLRMVGSARGTNVTLSFSQVALNWFSLVTTMALSLFFAAGKAATSLPDRYRYPILCLAVFSGGILLQSTQFQHSGMPLGLAFALICCSRLWTIWKQGRGLRSLAAIVLAVYGGAFIIYSMRVDMWSIVIAGRSKYRLARPLTTPFQSDALAGFVTLGPREVTKRPIDGEWLAQYVNDGLALLREHTSPGDSVASLDYINPFSFALKRAPSRGGATWLIYGDSYSDRFKPEPSMLLGTASVVMIPKWPTSVRASFEGNLRVYGPYLREHFNTAAESKLWILEKRNQVR